MTKNDLLCRSLDWGNLKIERVTEIWKPWLYLHISAVYKHEILDET